MAIKRSSKQYEWYAQKSGPKGYPMEMLSGTLFFKGEERGLPIPSGTSDGKWGEGFARHSHNEYVLPDRLELSFYSYSENQAYHGEFTLPYEKIAQLFQWGVDNPQKILKFTQPQFSRFVVAIAPGGAVGVWVAGAGEQREIFFGQAEKMEISLSSVFEVPFRSDEEAEAFRVDVLKEDVGEEQFKNIQTNGVPFDIWQRYRKPYHWVIEAANKGIITDLWIKQINAEYTKLEEESNYQIARYLTVPSYINFYFGPKLYQVNLDDYETIVVFEALDAIEGLTPEEKLIHIEITPRLPKETSTVRIYNAKQSIELKKALFKADRK